MRRSLTANRFGRLFVACAGVAALLSAAALTAAAQVKPDTDKPLPPSQEIEQKRLESARDSKDRVPLPPPPDDEEFDVPTDTHNGAVAAVDLKAGEVKVKLGEERIEAFVIDRKTKIVIDDKPARTADLKQEDPIIVTTMKTDPAETKLALKLEVVRLKRTSVPSDKPEPRPSEPAIRQLDVAVALGAICVPTPCESVLVVGVERDSPAAAAGIQTGDFILLINGEKPQDILLRGDLVYFIKSPKSGLKCAVAVWRAGKEYSTDLVVTEVDVIPKATPPVVVIEAEGAVVTRPAQPTAEVVVEKRAEVKGVVVEGDVGTKALFRELLEEIRMLRAEVKQLKAKP